jgi:hypothetical protein
MAILEACKRDGSEERNSRMSTITYGRVSTKSTGNANKEA